MHNTYITYKRMYKENKLSAFETKQLIYVQKINTILSENMKIMRNYGKRLRHRKTINSSNGLTIIVKIIHCFLEGEGKEKYIYFSKNVSHRFRKAWPS